jgi:hypothetical protein
LPAEKSSKINSKVPLLKKGLIDSIFTLFYNYKNYCSQLRNFDFMSIDYTHCLRPRFTQDILEHLLSSTSVNVMVPQIGEEATRLIMDIQSCHLPNVRVLTVNMRACREDYRQFLLDLWHQYYQQPTQENADLFAFLTTLEQAELRFLVILNHFQAMSADEVDKQYDREFYMQLNSLKNYRNVALLIITHSTYYHCMLFKIGEEFKTSCLDIQEIEDLPPLTLDEARYELTRRHPELDSVHISHLLRQAQHRELGYDYSLLDYLSRQFKHSPQTWDDMASFIRQIKNWSRQYHKRQAKQIGYGAQKLVGGTGKFFILFKIKHLFYKKFFGIKSRHN